MEYTKNAVLIIMKHHSCVIYRGIYSCGVDYIGETIRNSELKWNEHITGKDKSSYCVKHLNDNFDHEIRWFVLSRAFKNCLKRKILQAYQMNSDLLNLVRNGVT